MILIKLAEWRIALSGLHRIRCNAYSGTAQGLSELLWQRHADCRSESDLGDVGLQSTVERAKVHCMRWQILRFDETLQPAIDLSRSGSSRGGNANNGVLIFGL